MAVSLAVLISFVLRIASKAAATSLLMPVLLVPTGTIHGEFGSYYYPT